jgi:hypothetical protein
VGCSGGLPLRPCRQDKKFRSQQTITEPSKSMPKGLLTTPFIAREIKMNGAPYAKSQSNEAGGKDVKCASCGRFRLPNHGRVRYAIIERVRHLTYLNEASGRAREQ